MMIKPAAGRAPESFGAAMEVADWGWVDAGGVSRSHVSPSFHTPQILWTEFDFERTASETSPPRHQPLLNTNNAHREHPAQPNSRHRPFGGRHPGLDRVQYRHEGGAGEGGRGSGPPGESREPPHKEKGGARRGQGREGREPRFPVSARPPAPRLAVSRRRTRQGISDRLKHVSGNFGHGM